MKERSRIIGSIPTARRSLIEESKMIPWFVSP